MAASDVEICNLALHRIGAATISTLADNTAEARACTRFYERTLRSLLSMYDWPFAQRVRPLPLVGVGLQFKFNEDYTNDGLHDATVTKINADSVASEMEITSFYGTLYGESLLWLDTNSRVKVESVANHLAGDFSVQTDFHLLNVSENAGIFSFYKDARNYFSAVTTSGATSTLTVTMVVDGTALFTITQTGWTTGLRFVQVTRRRNTIEVYVDGASIGTATLDPDVDVPYGDLYIGGNPTTAAATDIECMFGNFQVIHGTPVPGVVPDDTAVTPVFASPLNGWTFEYVYPREATRSIGIAVEGDAGHMAPEDAYEIGGPSIYTSVEDAYIRYVTGTVAVTDFPIDFEEALVYKLATDLAMSLTGAAANETVMAQRFQLAFNNATANQSDVPAYTSMDSEFLSVRS